MERNEFFEQLAKAAETEGFTDCETYYQQADSFEVLVLEGKVSHYENSRTEGVSFRGNIRGRTGYACTEQLAADAIPFLVSAAKENAVLLPPEDAEELYPGEKEYPVLQGIHEGLERLSVSEKIDAAKRMEQAALAGAEEVALLDYCVLGTVRVETVIRNSRGLDVSFAKNYATAFVSAIARKGDETKTGSYFWKDQDWNGFDPEKTGREAARRAAMQLGAASVPSGKYDAVLYGEAMVALLGAFCGIFYAENVQKGFSLLGGKLGQNIASTVVTLRDDALLTGGYASTPFDSEGVSGRNKAVIENGTLRTFLYNRKSAKADGAESTGNGFKAALTAPVKTACTNFYLQKGTKSRDELFEALQNGLFITDLMGLHAGTNTVSGDFSLSASGFLIENGKLGRPVEQITIAGNFYRLLEAIEDVANDMYFSSGGKGSPSILVRGLDIAGM